MEIVEINELDWTEHQGLSSTGKRVKSWYARNSDGKIFLYKIPKRNEKTGFLTYEMWTEIIAYHIGKKLGLEIPAIYPARDQDSYGVLVENFREKEVVFYEAKDWLEPSGIMPSHNIALIEELFKRLGNKLYFWNEYKKLLIYDCLIGNNDRHDENWGLCFDFEGLDHIPPQKGRFAPIYDNASCLVRELNEEEIKDRIINNEQKFNKYISGKKSRPPNLYWNENDPKHYTHYELMQKLIEKEPDTKQIIEEFLQIDYISPVRDIIEKIQKLDVPDELKIRDSRAKAIIKILEARKTKMWELL